LPVGSSELRKLLGLRVMADCLTSYESLVWAVGKELCVRPGFREIALSRVTNGPTGRYLRLAHLGQ
jgi:hypothetical protein